MTQDIIDVSVERETRVWRTSFSLTQAKSSKDQLEDSRTKVSPITRSGFELSRIKTNSVGPG